METHRHTKDWLANLASSTQLCKKNMRKNQPWRCLCFGSALQITRMTPSRLTILQLRHNFLTEARTFIFTLRNFSGGPIIGRSLSGSPSSMQTHTDWTSSEFALEP